jgi:hypothetical protein
MTSPIAKTTAIHSVEDILKRIPAATTQTAANKCILALCSSLNKILIPLKANLKL